MNEMHKGDGLETEISVEIIYRHQEENLWFSAHSHVLFFPVISFLLFSFFCVFLNFSFHHYFVHSEISYRHTHLNTGLNRSASRHMVELV